MKKKIWLLVLMLILLTPFLVKADVSAPNVKLPDSKFKDIKDGYTLFSISVSSDKSYINAVYPNDYIDLYVKTKDQDGNLVIGKIMGNIEVISLHNASGDEITIDSNSHEKAAYLIIAIPDSMFINLNKIRYLQDTVIVPVAKNNKLGSKDGNKISLNEIKNILSDKGINIDIIEDSDDLDGDVPEPNIKPYHDDDDNSKITLWLVVISVVCSLIGTFTVIGTVILIVLLNEKKKKKNSEEVK